MNDNDILYAYAGEEPYNDEQEEMHYWHTIQEMTQLYKMYGFMVLEDLKSEIDKIKKV